MGPTANVSSPMIGIRANAPGRIRTVQPGQTSLTNTRFNILSPLDKTVRLEI